MKFEYYSVEKSDDNKIVYIFGFNNYIGQEDDPEEVYVDELYCIYSFSKTVSPKTGEDWEGPMNDYDIIDDYHHVVNQIFED